MRTNLAFLKNELFFHIINANYKHIIGPNINQKTFMLSFFPMSFLNTDENKGIIITQTNNSSRLSNIFNRATDVKRIESRFRARFVKAFTLDFFKEMVNNAAFFLKDYNADAFGLLVGRILQDEELHHSENQYIRMTIEQYHEERPELVLAVLILWAFHIGDFIMISLRIEEYLQERKLGSRMDLSDIADLIEKRHLKPQHVLEYLEITTKYSASCALGAIAMHAHIEKHNDINPLIYNEIANMHFYGHNYFNQDKKYALKMFEVAAEEEFGSALWTMGVVTNNEKHKVKYNRMPVIVDYFHRAIASGNTISLNNLGIITHRALIFFMKHQRGFDYATDVFGVESRKDAIEMYALMKSDPFFKALIEDHGLDQTFGKDFASLKRMIDHLKAAEGRIIEKYFHPSFQDGYFYAKGSELMIYENQYTRYHHLHKDMDQDIEPILETTLLSEIREACEDFAAYPCSESYYNYGKMLERQGHEYLQPAYEYYYNAVYEAPINAYLPHAISKLLTLQYEPYVPYKRDDIQEKRLIEYILNAYVPSEIEPETILLNTLKIYFDYVHDETPIHLSSKQKRQIQSKVMIEMKNKLKLHSTYHHYLDKLN